MVGKMRTKLLFASLLLFLMGCASTNVAPPRNIANACAILDERARWEQPVFDAANTWGVTPGTILAFMRQESGFRHDARPIDANGNRRSSALGYSQALDSTWGDYERARGRGKRDRFDDAADFMGWYLDHISKVARISKTDAKALYLAYHEGPTGYRRGTYNSKQWLLQVADRVGSQANIYDGQLRQCETRKMRNFSLWDFETPAK